VSRASTILDNWLTPDFPTNRWKSDGKCPHPLDLRHLQCCQFAVVFDKLTPHVEFQSIRGCEGGHDIPEAVIRRRYQRGIDNLFKLYLPLVADAYIYDGSQLPPELAWESIAGIEREISGRIWNAIQQNRKEKS